MKQHFTVIDEKFEASKNALRSYGIGFFLSLVLTIIPYYCVTRNVFDGRLLMLCIIGFAILQLFVQVIFFLHVPAISKPYWNIIIFVFTLMIIMFLVVGTLWIMYHLNTNMMGMTPFHSNEGFIPQ